MDYFISVWLQSPVYPAKSPTGIHPLGTKSVGVRGWNVAADPYFLCHNSNVGFEAGRRKIKSKIH